MSTANAFSGAVQRPARLARSPRPSRRAREAGSASWGRGTRSLQGHARRSPRRWLPVTASTTQQDRRNAQTRLGTIAEPLRWRANGQLGLLSVLDRHTSCRLSEGGLQSACRGMGEALDSKTNSAPPDYQCNVRRVPSGSRRRISADQAAIGFLEGPVRPREPAPASIRP